MLDINVTIEGQNVVIDGLGKLAAGLQDAVRRGLMRSALEVHRAAYQYLSGPGAQKSDVISGSYPVPVRTGHLRRSLDWLKPGESKSGPAGTFTAGQNEVIIYDSAEYANVVHEGFGSSAKFGSRPFLTDALEKVNSGDGIRKSIEEEVAEEIRKAGLE